MTEEPDMTEQNSTANRRRIVGITEILGHHRQAHACAELIDVLLRRDDLEHREELRIAAEALRWLFPNHVTRMTFGEVRTLVGTASVVARVAGLARHVWLPTVAQEIQRGSPTPYANVLDAVASFFAWLARERDRQEDRLFRDELIQSAIRLSRIAGQFASRGAHLEQHELDIAAHHLLEAMRVTVALIDPEAPHAYMTWEVESRARRAEDLERSRLELSLAAKLRADMQVEEPDDDAHDDGVGDAIAGDVNARASNDDTLN